MANFTSNQVNAFQLTFGGIPFLLDVARVVRLSQPHAEQESDRCNQAPEKYQPLAEICEELDRLLPFEYLQDFALPHYNQGRNLDAIARQEFVGPQPTSQLKINSYYYPPTASKWSVFRGLATSTAIKAMLAATQTTVSQEEQGTATLRTSEASPPVASFSSISSSTGNNPALFTLLANPLSPDNPSFDASLYTVQTDLYMLPPRPLAEHGGQFDGLFLVTLVDERYWWQYSPISLLGFNRNTWENLISDLATALNITIVHDPIETVYGSPEIDSQLWTNFENAGTLLDAVAANLGRTVVRLYDGSYVLRNALDSLAIVQENRNTAVKLVRVAGGDLFQGPGTLLKADNLNLSKNTVIPELVNVSFPVYVEGNAPVPHFLNPRYAPQRPSAWFEESFGDMYAVNVPIASGGISITGLGGTSGYAYSIHDTAKALVPDEQTFTPTNASGLTALSMQLAGDYYSSQVVAALDESYPGTLTWIPEGIHDILFTYSARMRQASTRILKTEWNQQVKNFQHATPPVFGFSNTPKGVGGPSVAQSWLDVAQPSTISTQLAADVTETVMSFVFKKIDYFPTQNRWRGQIDSEIILFEGTNPGTVTDQGVAITVVYRGIDGTLAATHTTGATITQIAPDAAYGINLVRHEKAQFVYPSEWTSGGIQGVNVVPELQTLQVLDDKGTLINKITHYSGRVQTYDSTQLSGFQWFNQELVWAVERTGLAVASGFRYGGQLTGYSASGMVAPVYAIGEGPSMTTAGTPAASLIVETLVNPLTPLGTDPPLLEVLTAGPTKRTFLSSDVADLTLNQNDGLYANQFLDQYSPSDASKFDKPIPGSVVVNQLGATDRQKGAVDLGPGLQVLGRGDKGFFDNVFLFGNQTIGWTDSVLTGKDFNGHGLFGQLNQVTIAGGDVDPNDSATPYFAITCITDVSPDARVAQAILTTTPAGVGFDSILSLSYPPTLFTLADQPTGGTTPIFQPTQVTPYNVAAFAINTGDEIFIGYDTTDLVFAKFRFVGGLMVDYEPVDQMPVGDGGTGASSFTTNGVLFGNGTDPLQVTTAGTTGQVLSAGSAPSFVDFNTLFPSGSNGQVLTSDGIGGISFTTITTSSPPFADNTALVNNNGDNTKLVIISAASVSTSTTRTLTVQDADYTLAGTSVALGGTGVVSFTANGILYGNGASPLQVTGAGTTGQVLAGNTGGAPTFQSLGAVAFTVSDMINYSFSGGF